MKQPCIPQDLQTVELDWRRLSSFTSKAMLEIARYDGTLGAIINPAVLLSPLTSQEAVLSSRIEGTQATLVEVLRHEAGEQYNEEKRRDIKEIINYRRALSIGEDYLQDRPLSMQMVREMHALLMQGVRGKDKNPGQFREDQNWIGSRGSNIEQARFIPPAPAMMGEHLEKLEAFMNASFDDPLVQLALVHAQFEIIHPFKDGNGRLGRMIVPLFLYQKKILHRPMFFISDYLDERDQEYRDRLLAITEDGKWQNWVEFFLDVISSQAKRNNEKAKAIHELYERMKPAFAEATKSRFSQAALDAFFTKPIISSTDFMKLSGIEKRPTAYAILKNLDESSLISLLSKGEGQIPSRYVLPELVNIAEGKQLFASQGDRG